MAVKRGRNITDFAQMFPSIGGAYIPPVIPIESMGWLGINQTDKLESNIDARLYSNFTGKLSTNIRGKENG